MTIELYMMILVAIDTVLGIGMLALWREIH